MREIILTMDNPRQLVDDDLLTAREVAARYDISLTSAYMLMQTIKEHAPEAVARVTDHIRGRCYTVVTNASADTYSRQRSNRGNPLFFDPDFQSASSKARWEKARERTKKAYLDMLNNP